MPKYVINGKTIEADSVLTDEEIDEIASSIAPATKEEAIQNEQVADNLNKEAQGIQPTVNIDGVEIPVTAERTQESVNKELESRVKEAEKDPENEPSWKRIATGLLAEIGISESSKVSGTLAGGAIAAGIGQMGPQAFLPEEIITVPAGMGIGYFLGSTGGGAAGNIAAQKIEGRDSINWGRAAVSALVNLIPGSKLTKGPQALIEHLRYWLKDQLQPQQQLVLLLRQPKLRQRVFMRLASFQVQANY
jgi:hypothetical protein